MEAGIDTIVLDEELAYADIVPLRFRSLSEALDVERAAALIDENLRLLQTFAALEDHGQTEKTDENFPHAADLMRIEFKVNLLLELVGQVLGASQPRPVPAPVRFNARGAIWKSTTTTPGAGEFGILDLWLRDALVHPLQLSGEIVSVNPDGRIKMRFDPVGEPVADLIEKMAFRRHRRQVAGARQPRR